MKLFGLVVNLFIMKKKTNMVSKIIAQIGNTLNKTKQFL